MFLKLYLYKLFFLIFIICIYNNFIFASSIKNNNLFIHVNNDIKKVFRLKKSECFSFVGFNKNFSIVKNKITIFNKNLIGVFLKNKFKIFYIVKLHDSLYSIAKRYGYNYNELSKFNFINKPYKIIVGQKIWIGDFFINENNSNCSIINSNETNNISCQVTFNNVSNIEKFFKNTTKLNISKICFFCDQNSEKNNVFSNNWSLPVDNRNVKYLYYSKSQNKQIEFFGFKEQPVFAAATGKVVFITDVFKKYGRLIILKHSQDYLSIYAFNSLILVKLQDYVHIHQQISTMGVSENNVPKLYFEIRYRGQSINPLNILPRINTKKVIY